VKEDFRTDVKNALLVLKQGGTILYPSDTIWGIGCDATNENAVKKINKIKGSSKSMLVLTDSANMLYSYIDTIPDIAFQLIEVSEKPLTIIYPKAKNLANNILGNDGSIGIRIVNDDFCKELIRQLRKPLVSTSANLSTSKTPQFFDEIDDTILSSVDYTVKWKQDDIFKSKPSSIIKIGFGGEIKIIRK